MAYLNDGGRYFIDRSIISDGASVDLTPISGKFESRDPFRKLGFGLLASFSGAFLPRHALNLPSAAPLNRVGKSTDIQRLGPNLDRSSRGVAQTRAHSKQCLQDADAARLVERPEPKQYRRQNPFGRGGFLLAPRGEVVSPLSGCQKFSRA